MLHQKKKLIAIVAAGYADGLMRSLSNKGFLYSDNTPCPIIGRVSMDLITVDISLLQKIPDYLQVIGTWQTIDFLADSANTIGYEILTSLGFRYKRIYHKN
jgi:alanine racemase